MAKKYDRLKEMIAGASGDAASVMERFLNEGDPLIVLELSDRNVLLQGHHRLAALYKAAREGVVPAAWLERIPTKVIRYEGQLPEELVRGLLTLGNDLTWAALLPPQNS